MHECVNALMQLCSLTLSNDEDDFSGSLYRSRKTGGGGGGRGGEAQRVRRRRIRTRPTVTAKPPQEINSGNISPISYDGASSDNSDQTFAGSGRLQETYAPSAPRSRSTVQIIDFVDDGQSSGIPTNNNYNSNG